MDSLRKNLHRVGALAIVAVCVLLIIRIHLFGDAEAISSDAIRTAVDSVQDALASNKPAAAPTSGYQEKLEESLLKPEIAVPGELAAWRFFPRKMAGEPLPRNYTVEALYASPEEARKALAAILGRKLAEQASTVGSRVHAGRFPALEDHEAGNLMRVLRNGGEGLPAAGTCSVIKAPPPVEPVYGVLLPPSLEAKLAGVGRVTVFAEFSRSDAHWSAQCLMIWRRRVGSEWPRDPHVTVVRARPAAGQEDGKVSVTVSPAEGAETSPGGGVVRMRESGLLPLESYEYRVGTAAVFMPSVKLPDGKECEVLPPKADTGVLRQEAMDAVLRGAAYAVVGRDVAKVSIPGDVQIQFSGKVEIDGTTFANFRMKRMLAGGVTVSTSSRFARGARISAEQSAKVGTKVQKVLIDSGMSVVEIVEEKRSPVMERPVTKKDPKTGDIVTVVEKFAGAEVTVDVVVLESIKTGERHRLDKVQPGQAEKAWWPDIPPISAESEGELKDPPVAPVGAGAPVRAVVPEPTIVAPPTARPVDGGAQVTGGRESVEPPRDPRLIGPPPPGPMPDISREDPGYERQMADWESRRALYEMWVKDRGRKDEGAGGDR
jgi:hypothetical protein